MATKRVPSLLLTRSRTALRPSFLASRQDRRDVRRLADRVAAGLEDHVADAKALLRRGAIGIDVGDDDAVAAGALHGSGRRELQPKVVQRGIFRERGRLGVGLLVVGQRAELDRDGLLRAIVPVRRSAFLPGPSAATLLGEFARTVDRVRH